MGSVGFETDDARTEGAVRGMEVNEAQEVRQLRQENARLKRLVACLSLNKVAVAVSDSKKRMELAVFEDGCRANAAGMCLQPAASRMRFALLVYRDG